MKHFRAYLLGNRYRVFTDHAPVRSLLLLGKLARWSESIDLEILYKPGGKNANADALSRSPIGPPDDELEKGVCTKLSSGDTGGMKCIVMSISSAEPA